MKLFLTREEKQLRKIYKSDTRRMTEEELRKIERAERFIDTRRTLLVSLIALFISVSNFILIIFSRL